MADNITSIGGGLVAEGAAQAADTPPEVEPGTMIDYPALIAELRNEVQGLNAYCAQLGSMVTLLYTLALRYHHQEIVAMLPPPEIKAPEYAPNALHLPS